MNRPVYSAFVCLCILFTYYVHGLRQYYNIIIIIIIMAVARVQLGSGVRTHTCI